MLQACIATFPGADISVMNAAVADYTPAEPALQKIKKTGSALSISLTKTTDILKHLGALKNGRQYLVGFALETNNEAEYAKTKLTEKNADMIVLNSLNDAGAGFGGDTNKITIFERSGQERHFEKKTKTEVAKDIVNTIIEFTK